MGRSALIAVIRHAGAESGEADAALLGLPGACSRRDRQAMAFTPDGKRLITGHETQALAWDLHGAMGAK